MFLLRAFPIREENSRHLEKSVTTSRLQKRESDYPTFVAFDKFFDIGTNILENGQKYHFFLKKRPEFGEFNEQWVNLTSGHSCPGLDGHLNLLIDFFQFSI